MAKEGGGLFSRVVNFVRSPATNWSELDQGDTSAKESEFTKQSLKEMIERKQRNDFVRKREFDMLRKVRQREAIGGNDGSARPSFFQSSMPSKPDDRAQTLKKIDEIEAQMSMQWWKTNVPNSSLPSSEFGQSQPLKPPAPPLQRMPQPSPAGSSRSYSATEPQPLSSNQVGSANATAQPTQSITHAPMLAEMSGFASRAAQKGPSVNPADPKLTNFSTTNMFAIEVEDVQHDAEHEEAAIRFANGDDAAAEAALLDVISPGGARANHDESWLTLFDLYRATGQADRFELKGLEFAQKFGKSAPIWFSIPEQVAKLTSKSSSDNPAQATSTASHWTAPSNVGLQTVAALKGTLSRVQQPWRLDWTRVKSFDAPAQDALTQLFASWAIAPVRLEFTGIRQLDDVLKAATPSGQSAVNPSAWRLRMETLRIMHRPDEFELAALDYCVTYEVSPPSWDGVKCNFKSIDPQNSRFGGHTIIGDAFKDSIQTGMSSDFSNSNLGAPSSMSHLMTTVELSGQILGDVSNTLEKLDLKLLGADLMVVSCAKLIRVDFSAAGTLLNWVSARQAEGRNVQFNDVHRMVAAFFNVIGISEHAHVVLRRD